MTPPLLILGASTRAAAFSALRSGRRPVCADLFADEDLRAVATVLPVKRYPHDLLAAVSQVQPGPWMYTGGIENHPHLIESLAAVRPLLGNQAAVVRGVRDPVRLQQCLFAAALPALDVRGPDEPPPADGRWLLKPRQSAAGRGIAVWNSTTRDRVVSTGGYYFQQRVEGAPISGLFLGSGEDAVLVGAARQLIGEFEWTAGPFQYCGSIGPIGLPDGVMQDVEHAGKVVAARFGLRGLFGCDFVADARQAWLVEVNPRYTASVEVYERAWKFPLLAWHIRVCSLEQPAERGQTLDELREELIPLRRAPTVVAKAIVSASREVVVPCLRDFESMDSGRDLFASPLADIPAAGATIAAGHPVCTVLAEGGAEPECRQRLIEHRERVVALLNGGRGGSAIGWGTADPSSSS